MRIRKFMLIFGVILVLEAVGPGIAQNNGAPPTTASQEFQRIHSSQSIDQELSRLTNDLELTTEQQQLVRNLLQEHHDKIQVLLDGNPNASRQVLGAQIHAISDQTHQEIHALLTDRQKELEKAMQQREDRGEENRRPAASAVSSPEPSPSTP